VLNIRRNLNVQSVGINNMKSTKIPFAIYVFFILVYFNQGISSLPSQSIYYLTRENWGLSASTLGLIGMLTSIAWYLKIFFGGLVDYCSINGYKSKYYLYFNYFLITALYIYIVIFGLNLVSLIIVMTLINICIAFNDTINDAQMVVIEQEHNLQGKVQATQWISLGVGGLIVSIIGAKIATIFPDTINYRVGYALAGIVPIITLIYLFKYYKEKPIKKKRTLVHFKEDLKKLKNQKFIIGIIFIACLQFTPCFGTPLMIKAREQMLVSRMFLGYLGATGTVLSLSGYLLYYWKFHKVPMKYLLYFMVVFTAITNLFYLYLPNQWALLAYSLAFGAFGGITFLTLLAFFVKIIPAGSEGLMYALVTSISNFAGRGGVYAGGVLFDHFGYNTTVIVSSVFTLCCLGLIPFLKTEE